MNKLTKLFVLILSITFCANNVFGQDKKISSLETEQAREIASLFIEEWKSKRDFQTVFDKFFINGFPDKCRRQDAFTMGVPNLPTDLLEQASKVLQAEFSQEDEKRFYIAFVNFQLLYLTYYLQSRNLSLPAPRPVPTEEENLKSLFPPGVYEIIANDPIISDRILKGKNFIAKTPKDLKEITETLEKVANLYRQYIIENPTENSANYQGSLLALERDNLSGKFLEPQVVYAESLSKCKDLEGQDYTLRKIIIKAPPFYWLVLTPINGKLKLFYFFLTNSF
ncbi:MAG: hypothetical protein HY819_20820 [Acidobacteria bacterium]|nr:hypothetical protein [Acidobacteriota bacterium]